MNRRAIWKGKLIFDNLAFEAGLYSALTAEEKVSFHIINRKTGNRVQRQYVDTDTGKAVDRDNQVRGYRLDDGDYVMVEEEALKQLMPESDKTLSVKGFIACGDVDKLYFDKPYYLAPAAAKDEEGFTLFTQALQKKDVAALAEAVLFRRNRSLLLRTHENALIATTLNFDYEVRSAKSAFRGLPEPGFDAELLELAGHIIKTRMGTFDPADYQDRYNGALRKLVEAKMAGRKIEPRRPAKEDNIIDLRDALRRSAKADGKGKAAKPPGRGSGKRRKAG